MSELLTGGEVFNSIQIEAERHAMEFSAKPLSEKIALYEEISDGFEEDNNLWRNCVSMNRKTIKWRMEELHRKYCR